MKKIIGSLYKGKCTIVEYQTIKDPVTKRNINQEVTVLENQPCRLSYKSIAKSSSGNTTEVVQVTKIIIDNAINVKPGSKLIVTQNAVTKEYKNSGEPAIYSNHQEIVVELFDRWA